MKVKVLQHRVTKKFAAIDVNSGYPYETEYPWKARFWDKASTRDIARFIMSFPEYKLVEVEMSYVVEKEYHVKYEPAELNEV